ncbi:asparagine synthase (glutamine-hydrolyzing) [Candidatus Woesearchaeota archaeon]|nr:asparagine synthase (glutamine-hydrolyzing) [Candidatus Woesearchaeota archaeon]
MCGIAGFYGFEEKALLKRMADIISHRGPDGEGYYTNRNVMLASRRLSIIDLATGDQPIFNEDKSIAIVYNGEIYNFQELRRDLERKGHRFYTNTDTEAIVHSYEEYGIECLKSFNGMFAFALYDDNKKQLLLARDRCGVKPLYYALLKGNSLLFASEIKSILQHPEVKREVDLDALNQYIRLRYVPGKKTMFKGINKLLPGHCLIASKKNIKIGKYWELDIDVNEEIDENYAIGKLRSTMQNAVKLQMISDVPIGSFLSGGLDTSAIVAFASKVSDKPINTFCMGFGESTDEFEYARAVADKFKTSHKELVVKFNLFDEFPKMIWHMDMPKRNLYPYLVYKEVAKHIKVIHSGMGGDELLGGYVHRYDYMDCIAGRKKSNNSQLPYNKIFSKEEYNDKIAKIRKARNPAEAYSFITSADAGFDSKQLKGIYSEKLKGKINSSVSGEFEDYFKEKGANPVEQAFYAEFNVKMPNDFLAVEDSMSMANSVEARVPFLDNNLIDFCFSLPARLKIRDGSGKYILRKMVSGVLPKKISKRKKWGFATTTHSLYKSELRDIAQNMLPNGVLACKKYISRTFIEKVLKEKVSEKNTQNYNLLWNLVAFEIWHKIYINPSKFQKPDLSMSSFLK